MGHVFTENPDGTLRFVGDFEGLYRKEPDPWSQSGRGDKDMSAYYSYSRMNLARALVGLRAQGEGLEVGCGLGYAIEALEMCGTGVSWSGADISVAALKRAHVLHPNTKFYELDFRNPLLKFQTTQYQVIVLNQTLWYVLTEMDAVMHNVRALLEANGLFVISQAFLRQQRWGTEIANGFPGVVAMMLYRFGGDFRLLRAVYDDSDRLCHHDGLLVFRKIP